VSRDYFLSPLISVHHRACPRRDPASPAVVPRSAGEVRARGSSRGGGRPGHRVRGAHHMAGESQLQPVVPGRVPLYWRHDVWPRLFPCRSSREFLTPPRLFPGDLLGSFLVRHDSVRSALAEPALVQHFDELRQGPLPRLLPVVGQATEFLRIHAELTSHLQVRMREVVTMSSLDPGLKIRRHSWFDHREILGSKVAA